MFDVSEANGGQPFDTLSDALTCANNVLLDRQKKGGMTIKYVQSSDNNSSQYVQCRYMGTAVTGNPNPFLDTANWQGVTNEVKAGSRDLVESGGVDNKIQRLHDEIFGNSVIVYNDTIQTSTTNPRVDKRIDLVGYDERTIQVKLLINTISFAGVILYCVSSYDNSHILSTTTVPINNNPTDVVIPEGTKGLWFFSGGGDSAVYDGTLYIEVVASESGAVYEINEEIDDVNESLSEINEAISGINESIDEFELELNKKSDFDVYVTKDIDSIIVKKAQGGLIIAYTFKPFGVNMLWQIHSVAFYEDEKLLYSVAAGSDSLGPYHVAAVNNADGNDAQGSLVRFTGGTHGYNGDSTGTPTARTADYKLIIDGKEIVENGNYSGNNVELRVKNRIQGWNTKKVNGSGREILEESIVYKVISTDDNLIVSNQIYALEAIDITLYYGMQIAFARDAVKYISEEKSEWNATTTPSQYDGDSLDCVLAKNASIVQKMFVKSYGLGRFYYVYDQPKAFLPLGSTHKSYYNLIHGRTCSLNAEDTVYLHGGFFFDYISNLVTDEYTVPTDKFQGVFDVSAYRGKQVSVKFEWDSSVHSGGCALYQATSIQSDRIISTEESVFNGSQSNTFTINDNTVYLWAWGGVKSVLYGTIMTMTLYLPSDKKY